MKETVYKIVLKAISRIPKIENAPFATKIVNNVKIHRQIVLNAFYKKLYTKINVLIATKFQAFKRIQMKKKELVLKYAEMDLDPKTQSMNVMMEIHKIMMDVVHYVN